MQKLNYTEVKVSDYSAENLTSLSQYSQAKRQATGMVSPYIYIYIYIYIYACLCTCWSPLWSSGQSSWLQIRRPGFDSRHYQEKKIVGLERGQLSLVSKTEVILDRKVAAPVYKTDNTALGIRHADHVAPSIRKRLVIISPTSCGRSVGIGLSRTQTMEFSLV
jgi:hypothetical protein